MSFWKSTRGRWGLVGCLCSCTLLVHAQAMKEKNLILSEYAFRLEEMEKEKLLAFSEKEELQLKIASQSDPAWIEMVLMRDLGVVPEGWLKVHFKMR